MSCNCNTANPNCEPCAFCTPPGVKCLPDCNPPDPCPEKIDLCCALYSGENHTCSNILNGDPLCDIILQVLNVVFPPSYCCALTGFLTVIIADEVINLTITSAGLDLGPYDIFFVDVLGNVTDGPKGIPKSVLFSPGYTFNINSNIVSIRLKSVSSDCDYSEFFVPPPDPPNPACFFVLANTGATVTWEDSTGSHTNTYSPSNPVYCANVDSLEINDVTAIILGGTAACSPTVICENPPSCICATVTNLSTLPTTINWIDCEGVFQKDIPLSGSGIMKVCGALVNSPGLVDIDYGQNIDCIDYGSGFICPTTTTTSSTTTTTTTLSCDCFTITNPSPDRSVVVNYKPCSGGGASVTVDADSTIQLCAGSIQAGDFDFLNTGLCITGSLCLPTTTTTTCPCQQYNLVGATDDYTYYNCAGDFVSGSTSDLTFCSNVSYGAITHSTLTLTTLGCCPPVVDCVCYDVESAIIGGLVTWVDCNSNQPRSNYYTSKSPTYCAIRNTLVYANSIITEIGSCINDICIPTTTTTTLPIPQSIQLGFNKIDPLVACGAPTNTYYVNSNCVDSLGSISIGCIIYTDSGLTIPFTNSLGGGYFSNGTSYWEYNNSTGIITGESCSSITTTTTTCAPVQLFNIYLSAESGLSSLSPVEVYIAYSYGAEDTTQPLPLIPLTWTLVGSATIPPICPISELYMGTITVPVSTSIQTVTYFNICSAGRATIYQANSSLDLSICANPGGGGFTQRVLTNGVICYVENNIYLQVNNPIWEIPI